MRRYTADWIEDNRVVILDTFKTGNDGKPKTIATCNDNPDELEQLQHRMESLENRWQTAQRLAEEVSRFTNSMQGEDVESFVLAMGMEHRTLQQDFTKGIVVKWLEHLAGLARLGPGHYDGRNEDAVMFAKSVVATREFQDGQYMRYI
jgi:hypothetical protein